MLSDWLEWLLNPCPRYARRLGYLRELINIRRARLRWGSAWDPHLEHARRFLLSAAALCPQKRKAVILGSGWWHDVPVAELADRFREVVLIDVVHPRAMRRQARRWPNVTLLDADVTGVAEGIYRAVQTGQADLPISQPTLFLDDDNVDFTASVMLLSQLHQMPEQFLNHANRHDPAKVAAFARQVVQAHWEYLQRLRGVVALITDEENEVIAETGRVVRRFGLLRGVELPPAKESWEWLLVPPSPRPPYHAHRRRVVGLVKVNGIW